jgi:hypothetical protein
MEITPANAETAIVLNKELKEREIYASIPQELHRCLRNPCSKTETFVSKRRENSQEGLP